MLWYIQLHTIPLYNFVRFIRTFLADVVAACACLVLSLYLRQTHSPFSSDTTDKKGRLPDETGSKKRKQRQLT